MTYWTFQTYKDQNVNEIKGWIGELSPKARVKFRKRISYLAITRIWIKKYAEKLKGYENIIEIKIRYHNIQYRPLGCCGPGTREFTLLIPAREVGSEFEPRHAPKTAQKRCKLIHQNRKYVDGYP
jgi:hypothetical protein